MICTNCGNKLNDHAKFCPECGTTCKEVQVKPVCTDCGAELKGTSRFCPECGKVQEPQLKVTAKKTCSKCGAELNEFSKFCLECGATVQQANPQMAAVQVETPSNNVQAKPQKKSALPIVVVIIIIAAVGLIAAKMSGAFDSDSSKPANAKTSATGATTAQTSAPSTTSAPAVTTTKPVTTTEPTTTTAATTTAVKTVKNYANQLIWASESDLIDKYFKGKYETINGDGMPGMCDDIYCTNKSLYKNIYTMLSGDDDDGYVVEVCVQKGGYISKNIYAGMSYNDLNERTPSMTGLCKDGTSLSTYYVKVEIEDVKWTIYFTLSDSESSKVNALIEKRAKELGEDGTDGVEVDASTINPKSSYAEWNNGTG
ncbi:MAG: zinc ribbon domain-containing protein [Oscillospiraceae bacterium]